MKSIFLFLAMITLGSLHIAHACEAHFSYSQSGGVVYFTNESTPVDTFTTFSWSFGDGGSSALLNPSHSYGSAGYYAVCLTMSNGFMGCSSTICDTIVVDSSNNNGGCNAYFTTSVSGNDAVFYNLSTWDSGQANYSWSFGDGATSTLEEPTHHYNQNGYYYPCLTITTTTGCVSSYCSYIQVIDTNCVISFTYQITGNEVTFIPSNANFAQGSFHWTFGDNSSSTEVIPTHTYSQPGIYAVCVFYSDSFCSAEICDSVTIPFGDSCYAAFNVYQDGFTAYFNPLYVDNSKTYSWDFGDGNYSSDTYTHHTYAVDGPYEICLTVSGSNCSATHCDTLYYTSDTTNNGGFFCIANFEVGDIDTVTNTIWLTDLSTGGIHYLWDFGDGSSSTEQYPTHTYDQIGSYYVCLSIICDSNLTAEHCDWIGLAADSFLVANLNGVVRTGFTLNVKPAEISGVVSIPASGALALYPNPASEMVNMILPEKINGSAIIVITNEVGQLVSQKSIDIKSGMTNEVDLRSLAPGLYFIRVIAEGKSFSGNIMKQ